jgi:hypothetical protein
MGNIFNRPAKNREILNSKNNIKSESLKSVIRVPNKDEIIDDIIERYMKNDLINNPAIPDWIERKIYKNVLKLSIGLISDTFNNTEIEFLGHSITVSIKPKKS